MILLIIKSCWKLGLYMRICCCIDAYCQKRTVLKSLMRRGKKNWKRNWRGELTTLIKNKETRQISYKITFRLICYEKEGYIFKRNNHFTSDYSINTSYNELHQIAQEYYYIPESSDLTYLNLFYGKKIETGFKDLGAYAFPQKEKKRQFNYIFTTIDLRGSCNCLKWKKNVMMENCIKFWWI